MKTKSFMIALATSLVAISVASAADKDKPAKAATPSKTTATQMPAKAEGAQGEFLTGSSIKQKVQRAGRITNGQHNLVVLDRDAIEHSGASDVRQLLIMQGAFH